MFQFRELYIDYRISFSSLMKSTYLENNKNKVKF